LQKIELRISQRFFCELKYFKNLLTFSDFMSCKGPPPMTKVEIYSFLEEMEIARLCSMNKNSTIHSVPVWYSVDGENIIICTPVNSQKALNIKRNNNVTVMIDNQKESTKVVIVYGEAKIDEDPSDDVPLTIFRRYMDEEEVQQYLVGAKKLTP
jgi:nitroimidazol reductase NimA-like FMN-containing flavoprotein (pyridoxamine 5'-phosphate oxidase superfamily)